MSRHWGKKPKTPAPGTPSSKPATPAGEPWSGSTRHVTKTVVSQVQRYVNKPTGLTPQRSVEQIYQQLGRKRFEQIMTRNGRTPARSTINRWRRENRIPAAAIEEQTRRADRIERLGGTKQAAQQLGVSESSVRRYTAGKTRKLRSDAARKTLRNTDNMTAAQAAGVQATGQPKIVVRGDFSIVLASGEDYVIASREITMTSANYSISDEQNEELFDAYVNDRLDEVAVQVESILTTAYFGANYEGFDTYSADNRVRIDHIDHFTLEWP